MCTAVKPGSPPVGILIAEDSPMQAQKLQHIREQQGYEVTIAANGLVAFEIAQRRKPTLASALTQLTNKKVKGL